MTTERPGGAPRPFWVAEMTMSSPQSSKRISSDATEQTASRAISESGEFFLIISEKRAAGERTPVEVSTWVIVTSLNFLD